MDTPKTNFTHFSLHHPDYQLQEFCLANNTYFAYYSPIISPTFIFVGKDYFQRGKIKFLSLAKRG